MNQPQQSTPQKRQRRNRGRSKDRGNGCGTGYALVLVFLLLQIGMYLSWQRLLTNSNLFDCWSNTFNDDHNDDDDANHADSGIPQQEDDRRIDWSHANGIMGNDGRPPLDRTAGHTLPEKSGIDQEEKDNDDDSVQVDDDSDKKREHNAEFGGLVPRAFPSWPKDRQLPCGKAEDDWWTTERQRSPAKKGYLFVKEMKTGSSTVGGVVLRIARKLGARYNKEGRQCIARIDHSAATTLQYGQRDKDRSFLFTVLREPNKRMVSEFFHFAVSRRKVEPTDSNFQEYILARPTLQDYYIRSLNLVEHLKPVVWSYSINKNDYSVVKGIRQHVGTHILHNYDFIGITERMDESLVVMQLLLGLNVTDILYLKAKGSGGFDDGAHEGKCFFIVPSHVSSGMQTFFDSDDWKNRTQGDVYLYRAANKSLDMTIEQLGTDRFQKALGRFRMAQKLAHERCDVNKIRFPCSANGKRAKNFYRPIADTTDCLWLDSGCGYGCLDDNAAAIELEVLASIP